MEWFVAIVFIGGLIWVAVEAIKHAGKRQPSNKAGSSDTRTSHG